jgi:Xaa-Pro aminopeptidase
MKNLPVFLFTLLAFNLYAQDNNLPDDLLSMDFHEGRRDALRQKLPDKSVAVFFANPIRNRANDVDYMYHQDPNFYYLTGHRQPGAMLLIFKEKQQYGDESTNEILFVRGHNATKELYNGPRLDKSEVRDQLGIALAYEGSEFEEFPIDFSKFDQVIFKDFYNDVRNSSEKDDLYDLISTFKVKTGYQDESLAGISLEREPQKNNLNVDALDSIMAQLRGIKTREELDLLRKAAKISALGQVEVMKAMEPGMSELEVQGMHEFVFKKFKAEYEGYPSIVGAGHNGCVLHYIENYKPEIEDGELILMDLGAEYHGYTADVTRTIPVNGTFTKEQKLIYDLVYKAQEAGITACRAGASFQDVYKATLDVVNRGLVELGLYESTDPEDTTDPNTGRNRYYPHGCCHHIGLDVHDAGEYVTLEENMVITIEPGIYITEGSPADEKWWDIPVRIEDDFLVSEEGCENLSAGAPRTSEAIEALMKQESAFNSFELPVLNEE